MKKGHQVVNKNNSYIIPKNSSNLRNYKMNASNKLFHPLIINHLYKIKFNNKLIKIQGIQDR